MKKKFWPNSINIFISIALIKCASVYTPADLLQYNKRIHQWMNIYIEFSLYLMMGLVCFGFMAYKP